MNETVNIILVDDHRLVLDGIASMLQHSLFRITGMFTDGDETWDWLQSGRRSADIIVTDISMPKMSGTDLCKKVKAVYPEIKVLMLSMYSTSVAIDEALLAEADGFVLKNASKEELLLALQKLSNGGTFFSEEIMPLLYKQILSEKKKEDQLAVLTAREREILQLIAQELTSDEIASKLFLSKKTVDNHRTNMLQKTNSRSTIGLVKFAIRNTIIGV